MVQQSVRSIRAGTLSISGFTPNLDPNATLIRLFMPTCLMRRTLLLSGDFFLGGVIAVNLAKLVLRLRALGISQVSSSSSTVAQSLYGEHAQRCQNRLVQQSARHLDAYRSTSCESRPGHSVPECCPTS